MINFTSCMYKIPTTSSIPPSKDKSNMYAWDHVLAAGAQTGRKGWPMNAWKTKRGTNKHPNMDTNIREVTTACPYYANGKRKKTKIFWVGGGNGSGTNGGMRSV